MRRRGSSDSDSGSGSDNDGPLVINIVSTARSRRAATAPSTQRDNPYASLSLREFGYANVSQMREPDRRKCLVRAILSCRDIDKVVGVLEWCQKVNRRSHPDASRTFAADRRWIEAHYEGIRRHLTAARATSATATATVGA